MLTSLKVKLENEEKDLIGKPLLKTVMRKFLPAADALLEMMVVHLPSPATAQRYRVNNLYEGPMDDECAEGIRNCDPNGPLMLYVSKMVPTNDKGRFYALDVFFQVLLKLDKKLELWDQIMFQVKKMIYILKSGTISDNESAYNIKVMKFSVSPVVRVAVG